MIHAAPETTSQIISKSVSKDGGNAGYRGLVRVEEWRPDPATSGTGRSSLWCAVGRKR